MTELKKNPLVNRWGLEKDILFLCGKFGLT